MQDYQNKLRLAKRLSPISTELNLFNIEKFYDMLKIYLKAYKTIENAPSSNSPLNRL